MEKNIALILFCRQILPIFSFLMISSLLLYLIFSNLRIINSTLKQLFNDTKSNIKSIIILLILLYIILSLLILLRDMIYNISVILHNSPMDLISFMSNPPVPNKGSFVDPNNVADPVRWWPSGVPQTWTILGSALAIYRFLPAPPRFRAIIALGSMGISIPSMVYFNGIENPNGFNRLMYSFDHRLRTGVWPNPNNVPNEVTNVDIDNLILNRWLQEMQRSNNFPKDINTNFPNNPGGPGSNGGSGFNGGSGGSGSSSGISNNFVGDNIPSINDLSNTIADKLVEICANIFNPVLVEGYLDDLIGQHLLFQILLYIVAISILLLFIVFLFLFFILQHKEYVINKFQNKYIKMYIKYQFILAKISYYIIPILILFGLIEMIVILHYTLSHPIPYHILPINLHTYIKP